MFELGHNYSLEAVGNLQELAGQVDNPGAAQHLHASLKTLKTGTITFSDPTSSDNPSTFRVTWDERRQEFSAQEISVTSAMGSNTSSNPEEKLTGAIVDIAQKLTECADIDREARRADRYVIGHQDQHQFLPRLLSSESNTAYASSIAVVHENREEILRPGFHLGGGGDIGSSDAHDDLGELQNLSNTTHSSLIQSGNMELGATSELSGVMSSELPMIHASDLKKSAAIDHTGIMSLRDKPVLVYGFDKTYRKTLIGDLKSKFGLTKMQTMNKYMRRLNITGEFGFEDYCNFRKETNEGRLGDRIIPAADNPLCTNAEAHAWAGCLTRNISKFDFSKKCDSSEKKKLFFIKNCDVAKVLDLLEGAHLNTAGFKAAIKNKNWDDFIATTLGPAFDLLENKDNLSVAELQQQYRNDDYLTPDARIILDVVLCKAFFRKTSKLGLTFAREQEITVIFAWDISGANSLEQLHDLLEVKQYKIIPPGLRVNSQKKGLRQLSPEATTFSEMRELGRLMQKMVAPNYILMKGVTSTIESFFDDYDRMAHQYVNDLDQFNQEVDAATEVMNKIPSTDTALKQDAINQLREAGGRLQVALAKARAATTFANLSPPDREAMLQGSSFEEMINAAMIQASEESNLK